MSLPLANPPFKKKERRKEKRPAIWAVNVGWLFDKGKAFFKYNPKKFRDIRDSNQGSLDYLFRRQRNQTPFVHQANSFYLHRRLSIQQGVFLCATNIEISFEENLKKMKGTDDSDCIKKYVISDDCIPKVFEELNKMNINRTSLFPGLDGFAQSLMTRASLIPKSGGSPR